MINGFVKVNSWVDGSFTRCELWNPETTEHMVVIADDAEYMPGDSPFVKPEYLNADKMTSFDGSDDIRAAWETWHYNDCLKNGVIIEGMTVEVFKGRKYPIGTIAKVDRFYDVYDRYGRLVADYILTTDGKRIPKQNCKPIA